MEQAMVYAHRVSLGSASVFLLSVLLLGPRVELIVPMMFVHSIGSGVCSPIVSVQVMGVMPRLIGSAAGLYGCLQMMIGALCAALVTLHPDAALAASGVMVGAGVLGQLAFWIARRSG